MVATPEYRAWGDMLSRCNNPKSTSYEYYGGRGIRVCNRWADSFEAFYADMGPKPSPDHSIDRRNVNRNYEPGNCRWATPTEQARNKTDTHFVDFRGEQMSAAEVAERTGINYHTFLSRIHRGISVEEAISTPTERLFKYLGREKTSSEWAREFGLSVRTVNSRIAKGWSIEKALTTPV